MLDATSSFSHERRSAYDAGTSSVLAQSTASPVLSLPDLGKILACEDAKDQIQALPCQTLYHALKLRGIEDALEVLPLISNEQFVRICDYDVWHEDRLAPKQLFRWLSAYGSLSPQQLVERFRSLDEEYQLAALGPFVKIYMPEEFERMSDEQQDQLFAFPANALYYAIDTQDPDIYRGVEEIMQAAMGEDMNYAMALASHAAFMPPGEQEHLLSQFRNARLEEDGFICYEESLSAFYPLSLEELGVQDPQRVAANSSVTSSTLRPSAPHSNLLERSLAYGAAKLWSEEESDALQRGFLSLANSLCVASKIEPDDLSGLRFVLSQAKALVSLGLEKLSADCEEKAAALLLHHYPKTLFRLGLGLVAELRSKVLHALNTPKTAEFVRAAQLGKSGFALDWLDMHGLELWGMAESELLKGLFNRYPYLYRSEDNRSMPLESLALLHELERRIAAIPAVKEH